ncbi:uncharacterized protein LOC116373369 [Oncorhynchus kisutch]|uniref:uncharacterized protein LOC116373369 n=1 Tax=Oncorhynchus kisutch TaxID=8019 RepID=UPI0012DD7503|nr:uncharacterized protein LOC116373369 [Oncorhynchus kisutch]
MINCGRCGRLAPGELEQEDIHGVVLSGTTWLCEDCYEPHKAYLIERIGEEEYFGAVTSWGFGVNMKATAGRRRVAIGRKEKTIVDFKDSSKCPCRPANWKYGSPPLVMKNVRTTMERDTRREPQVMLGDLEKFWTKEDLEVLEKHQCYMRRDKAGAEWHESTVRRFGLKWKMLDCNIGACMTDNRWVEMMLGDIHRPRASKHGVRRRLIEEEVRAQKKVEGQGKEPVFLIEESKEEHGEGPGLKIRRLRRYTPRHRQDNQRSRKEKEERQKERGRQLVKGWFGCGSKDNGPSGLLDAGVRRQTAQGPAWRPIWALKATEEGQGKTIQGDESEHKCEGPNWSKIADLTSSVVRCEAAAGDLRRELKYIGDELIGMVNPRSRKGKKKAKKGRRQ